MVAQLRDISSLSAIVTGASQGIGKSIGMALAVEGVHTVLASRSLQKLEAVKKEIGNAKGEVDCMSLNLADLSSIKKFAETVEERIPRLDILVHCGGLYANGSIKEASIDRLDELLDTNVRGVYALTQLLLPQLENSNGDIVFANSSIIFSSARSAIQFGATQHALLGIANSIRAEVNDKGVRVLTVFPGRTATPRQEKIFALEGKDYEPELLLQPTDIAEITVACLKLADTAEVTDLNIRPRQKW